MKENKPAERRRLSALCGGEAANRKLETPNPKLETKKGVGRQGSVLRLLVRVLSAVPRAA